MSKMEIAGATGGAFAPTFEAVDHDVPTDPVKLRATQLAHAEAAVKAAKAKVDKLTKQLASGAHGTKGRIRAHLEGAQKALAEAIAARKEL